MRPVKPISPPDWRAQGTQRMTDEQRRLLNAACGDLAQHLLWHSIRLSKDDYRHLICGTLLGFRTVPGIELGDGKRGWIMLGGSSLDLTRTQATDAITLAFHLGDFPAEQDIDAPNVPWCDVVCGARGITDSERVAA